MEKKKQTVKVCIELDWNIYLKIRKIQRRYNLPCEREQWTFSAVTTKLLKKSLSDVVISKREEKQETHHYKNVRAASAVMILKKYNQKISNIDTKLTPRQHLDEIYKPEI